MDGCVDYIQYHVCMGATSYTPLCCFGFHTYASLSLRSIICSCSAQKRVEVSESNRSQISVLCEQMEGCCCCCCCYCYCYCYCCCSFVCFDVVAILFCSRSGIIARCFHHLHVTIIITLLIRTDPWKILFGWMSCQWSIACVNSFCSRPKITDTDSRPPHSKRLHLESNNNCNWYYSLVVYLPESLFLFFSMYRINNCL